MENLSLILPVLASTGSIIILLVLWERKYNFIEKIIGKKLKVVYFTNQFCFYKIDSVDGVLLAVDEGEYSCSFGGDEVQIITEAEYEISFAYGVKDPFFNILHRRYENLIFSLIFAGKFLPKYKCIFHLPSSDSVRQGKISTVIPPIPKSYNTFKPS